MSGLSVQSAGGVLTAATLATIKTLAACFLPTQGNVFFVCPYSGNDSNPGTAEQPLKTLAQALSLATANQNDVVFLCAQNDTAALTTDFQSANLNWNKDMVHLIGINAGSFCSSRSRVGVNSAAAGFANLFTLSANDCLIQGIQFIQEAGATTLSAASTCVTVTGKRNVFSNCSIQGIVAAGLDYAGSNSLTINGASASLPASENLFQHCYIGTDTIIRSTATYEVLITGVAARTIFEDCHFASYTSLTTFRAVSIGTSVDRFVKFLNCTFEASVNITGVGTPAGCLGITTMNGQVFMINPALFGYALIASGGNTYVKVITAQAATTVQGIGASAAAS
jgi:hypothetical protein